MSDLEKKIKIAVRKRASSARKKTLELNIEVERKLLQGSEWMESLGRLQSLENHIKDYIDSAERQLKGDSTASAPSKTPQPNGRLKTQSSNSTL